MKKTIREDEFRIFSFGDELSYPLTRIILLITISYWLGVFVGSIT